MCVGIPIIVIQSKSKYGALRVPLLLSPPFLDSPGKMLESRQEILEFPSGEIDQLRNRDLQVLTFGILQQKNTA